MWGGTGGGKVIHLEVPQVGDTAGEDCLSGTGEVSFVYRYRIGLPYVQERSALCTGEVSFVYRRGQLCVHER